MEDFTTVAASSLSRQALRLHRLLTRLARRDGFAAVRTEKLCVMLAEDVRRPAPYSLRAMRYYLAELRAGGWIETQTDFRMIYARPLVAPPPVSRVRRPPRPFSAREIAQPMHSDAPDFAQPPKHISDVGDTEHQQAPAVVVSLLSKIPGVDPVLAADAGAGLTPEDAQAVLVAAGEQRRNIRSVGAWLRWACRVKARPNAVASGLSSAQERSRPVRIVRAPEQNVTERWPAAVRNENELAGLTPRERLARLRGGLGGTPPVAERNAGRP
jgi:hypothetical protein